MNWKSFGSFTVIAVAAMSCLFGPPADSLGPFTSPRVAAADDAKPRDLNKEVLKLFTDRCAQCHGPKVRKPRGRFGYVLDLKRIRENPEMVIPGKPEESELLQMIDHDEMPPPDSGQKKLTRKQKQLVRDWIAASK